MAAGTRKRWVKDLLTKRHSVEEAIGMPLGDILGCGHFGCVFRSEGPWVVKLSIDPTEGPIWATIGEKIEESRYGSDGFARVKSITRLKPDVGDSKRKNKLYAIVREDCEPLLTGTSASSYSDYTKQKMGVPNWTNSELHAALTGMVKLRNTNLPMEVVSRLENLQETLKGIHAYREWGHQARLSRPGARSHDRERFGMYGSSRTHSYQECIERALRATNLMNGAIGGALGESLSMLGDYGIVLFDVHLGNVGWRVHENIDGLDDAGETLVVYDPGHTPTDQTTAIQERFVANARWEG
jgi:hypothetical protein